MLDFPGLPLDRPGWIFAVLALVILLVPLLVQRVRVPGIVGLILAGTVIGPAGLGLVERTGMVALLGTAGLLYVMFLAGLELDLDDLRDRRRDGVVYGTTGFVFPMLVGVPVIAAMGFEIHAAVLLASCWASHTLLSYPAFRQFGVTANRAVATSVGATVLTDTAALLVLVVVVRAYAGALDAGFWVSLAGGLGILVAATLFGLPRLARWFFSSVSQERTTRVVFLLVALFGAATLAQLTGVEAIIGAFLAGLALNRLVPKGSALMRRVDVLGESLLIPLFLISVGMLVDVRLLADPSTLFVAGGFTAVAIAGKLMASEVTGRMLRYEPVERLAMFSLTSAQAAATLAAVFVGLEAGLIATETVNAVVAVILVTCLLSSWTAAHAAPRLHAPVRERPIGRLVVVPIARPASAVPLAVLAAAIARSDAGMLVPVTVVPPGADEQLKELARELGRHAEQAALAAGVEARGVLRVDSDPANGILHTVMQEDASLLVVGWEGDVPRGTARFGEVVDRLVDRAPTATLVARLDGDRWRRVVVGVAAGDTGVAGLAGLLLALAVAQRVGRDLGIRVEVVRERDVEDLDALLRPGAHKVLVDPRRRDVALREHCGPRDLVIVGSQPTVRGWHGAMTSLERALPEASLVVALDHRPAHPGTALTPAAVRSLLQV